MIFSMGVTTISWMLFLQEVTTLSTTKAEYIAAMESFKEAKKLKGLIRDLLPRLSLIYVNCDSQSAIHFGRNQNTFCRRTKHIDVM